MRQRLVKMFRDIGHVVVGSGAARALTLLNSLLVARRLGAEEFGRFSLFYICLVLAWQMPQGLDTTYIRFAKRAGSAEEKAGFLQASLVGKTAYAALILLLCPALYAAGRAGLAEKGFVGLVALGLAAGCSLSFNGGVTALFQEREQFGRFSLMNNVTNASFTAGVLGLLLLPGRFVLENILGTYALLAAGIGIWSYAFVARRCGGVRHPDLAVLKRSLAFGKWIVGVSTAYFLFQRIDVLVLSRYVSYKDLGIYSAAAQVALIISLFTGSMSAVFLPKAMEAVSSRERFRRYALEAVPPSGLVVLGVVLLMVGAPYLVGAVYGEEFSAAGGVLRILLVGWVFSALYIPYSYVFYALDRPRTRFFLELTKVSFACAALAVLVPRLGGKGAALGLSLTLLAEACVSGWVLQRILRARLLAVV
jgi:PST family polysaccharide transporter